MKPRLLPWLSAAPAASLRRALVALCVLGSLLTVPIAATTHELQHLRGGQQDAQDKQGHSKSACEVCAAYASLGHALAFKPPAALVSPPATPEVRASTPRADGAHLHLYLERAPPYSPVVA